MINCLMKKNDWIWHKMKKASVFIESFIVFVIILCCLFIAMPFFIGNKYNGKNITIWAQKFSNIQYAYSVLRIQMEEDNSNFMSSKFQHKLKTFLRETKTVTSNYKPEFLNKKNKFDTYVFDRYFENVNGLILGFKWINPKCSGRELCAVMSVDINGYEKPNVWGKDIFAVNFYSDTVEPAGKRLSMNKILKDCSKAGTGVYCSAYYLIGGLNGK